MADNRFWWGVVIAHDDMRRAAARRTARQTKALRRSRGRADRGRSHMSSPRHYVVLAIAIVTGVWLWLH